MRGRKRVKGVPGVGEGGAELVGKGQGQLRGEGREGEVRTEGEGGGGGGGGGGVVLAAGDQGFVRVEGSTRQSRRSGVDGASDEGRRGWEGEGDMIRTVLGGQCGLSHARRGKD